jgi:hypothetical protein
MPGERVIAQGESRPSFDLHCPLLSLPLLLGTMSEQTIPNRVPYVQADRDAAAEWGRRMANDGARLRVGLAWAGNAAYSGDRDRSIRLQSMAPLARVARQDVRFYSLQKGPPAEEAKNPPGGMKLIDLASGLTDFADAAIVANLDLVISVDTAVAHLAGAMGKPVWCLLSFAADWRWMLDRDDSPWYPTARLFRQPAPGDWASVIDRVAQTLSALGQ